MYLYISITTTATSNYYTKHSTLTQKPLRLSFSITIMDDSSTEPARSFPPVYEDYDNYDNYSEPTVITEPVIKGIKVESRSYTLKRKIDGKYKKILLFPTEEHLNAHMFNAVTGIPYYNDGGPIRYTIGTVQEDDVFKVKFMSGENGVPPLMLCYDSPEQYEKHTQVTVGQAIKEKWYNKNKAYRLKRGL